MVIIIIILSTLKTTTLSGRKHVTCGFTLRLFTRNLLYQCNFSQCRTTFPTGLIVLTPQNPGGCHSLLLAPSVLYIFGHLFHYSSILLPVPILLLQQLIPILLAFPPKVFQINSSFLLLLHCHKIKIKSILLIRFTLMLPLKRCSSFHHQDSPMTYNCFHQIISMWKLNIWCPVKLLWWSLRGTKVVTNCCNQLWFPNLELLKVDNCGKNFYIFNNCGCPCTLYQPTV